MQRTTVSAVFLVLLAGACSYPGFGGFKEKPNDAGADVETGGNGGALPEAGEDADAAVYDAADAAEEAPSYECLTDEDCHDAAKGGKCEITSTIHRCVPCLPAEPA